MPLERHSYWRPEAFCRKCGVGVERSPVEHAPDVVPQPLDDEPLTESNASRSRRHTVPVDGSRTSSVPFSGCALRRVTVAPDLDALRGPLHGRFQLPLHLDASARAVYDFAFPAGRELAYRVVLLEAGSPLDHEQWLDREELLRLWSDLYLPRVVRAAWQAEHPVLARIGAGPQVPQL